ncbi:MAG: isocitrate lyase/phosphoenolpyruvate mutase family protein [Spirochaetales bacterium]|nr:isocitrate lyase/phosphoenolpyruvate mutase family protein [Spirochaetales bacterium]
MYQYNELKELLKKEKPLLVPDAYDMLSAKIIQSAGFKAVQCSGYSFSINNLLKNEKALSFEKNIEITQNIVKTVTIPVMADGEDGYATGPEFQNNIERFIMTGIAGINIEDQILYDKSNKSKIVDEKIFIEKINIVKAIKKSLNMHDFILNARTDALHAFEDRKKAQSTAIERANAYLEAGADLCFVTGIQTKQELRLFAEEINGPLSVAAGLAYNIHEFDINDCRECNISRVSLPSFLLFTTIHCLAKNLETVKQEGSFEHILKNNLILKDAAYVSQMILKQ